MQWRSTFAAAEKQHSFLGSYSVSSKPLGGDNAECDHITRISQKAHLRMSAPSSTMEMSDPPSVTGKRKLADCEPMDSDDVPFRFEKKLQDMGEDEKRAYSKSIACG
jgi:hypothetical protein